MTCVKDLMECEMKFINPDSSLQEAALIMKDADCGFLPVGRNNMPEGIITDRDIVVRAVAEGKDLSREKVEYYMTNDVCVCQEGDTLEQAARLMRENNVSRLVVVSGNGKVSGVLTFGRILRTASNMEEANKVVEQATGKAA